MSLHNSWHVEIVVFSLESAFFFMFISPFFMLWLFLPVFAVPLAVGINSLEEKHLSAEPQFCCIILWLYYCRIHIDSINILCLVCTVCAFCTNSRVCVEFFLVLLSYISCRSETRWAHTSVYILYNTLSILQ